MEKIPLYLLLFFFSSTIFISCKPEPDPEPDLPIETPMPGTKLDVVWTKAFLADPSSRSYFNDPLFWDDYLVVGSCYLPEPGVELGIRVLHKVTGEDHLAWRHEPGGVVEFGHTMECLHIGGENRDILFTGDREHIYAIDLNSGQRKWKQALSSNYSGHHLFSMLGASPMKIYHPKTGGMSDSWCRVAHCDLQTGALRDLLEIERDSEVSIDDDFTFLLRPAAWLRASNGDSLIFFLSSGWNFTLAEGKMTAYCYNVTKREMVWKKNDFVEGGDAGHHTPVIIDNQRVVFTAIHNAHSFDIQTGELLWQYLPGVRGHSDTPPLYHDGKLYIRTTNGIVTCLDTQTGVVLWETGDSYIPAPDGRMDIYNGKLYFAAWGPTTNTIVTFHLYCLDAATGQKLWSDVGPVNSIVEGVVIDQELGYLYCMGSNTIICVNLNNTPK